MNIKRYFAFTKGEKRGALVLTSLLFIIICFRLIDFRDETAVEFDYTEFDQEIATFLNAQKEADSIEESITFFPFNPNTASPLQWKQLGFKDWQITSIQKYKAKGGQWKTKHDVSRIYGLSEEHYQQLKPFIQLPEQKEFTRKKSIQLFNFNPNRISLDQWKKLGFKDWQIKNIEKFKAAGGKWNTKNEFAQLYGLDSTKFYALKPFIQLPEEKASSAPTSTAKININKASSIEIMNLPGINSSKYATIILKYRNKLGGFSNKEQLLEVWGMKPDNFQKLKTALLIDVNHIKKLNINNLGASSLVKHPYIDWKVANSIEKYRKAHGNYQKIEELRSIHLIDDTLYQKIRPYLKLQE